MENKMYQCCYTNLTQEVGGKTQSGWQTVAVSQDIPSEAYKKCEQLQRINSTIPGSMVDENGEVLNLLEISGDDKFVYVMRTQYGLQDRLGRRNMFSHAYILHWEDAILEPNSFLRIVDKENFKTDEKAALQLLEKQDREICWLCGYTIDQAMEIAGLNLLAENYPKLIGCVYAKISERRLNEPLYIQCNGEEQMRALLFCIYYGLPHHLRKKLHVASAAGNNTENKHIIFSRAALRQPYYLDPRSGDNTVFSGRLSRKVARYGYIDYVARNTAERDYFVRLAEEAANLGDLSASDELILKIAHKRLMVPDTARYSGSEVDELLADALRSSSFGSTAMCQYITQLLNRVREEQRSLTDETQNRLAAWRTASVLSTAQLLEFQQLVTDFTDWKDENQAAVKTQISEKYHKQWEKCQEELMDVTEKNRKRHLSQVEDEIHERMNRKIKIEYDKRTAELMAEQKRIEEASKPAVVGKVHKMYRPQLEEAKRCGQDRLVAALEREQINTIQSYYTHLLQHSQASLNNKLEQMLKEIVTRTNREQKNVMDQNRARIEEDSKRLLEELLGKTKEELGQQEKAELKLEYDKLALELESGKPARLKELEAKADLARAIKEYTVSFIKSLSQNEVLRVLEKMREDKLSQFTATLSEVEGGVGIVSTYCHDLLQKQPLSWEMLRRILAASDIKGIRTDQFKQKLSARAWELYCQSLDWADGAISPDFDQYRSFLTIFLPPDQADAKIEEGKQEFWKRMSFAHFSMDTFPEYSQMTGETGRSHMFSEFYAMINNLPTAAEEEFLSRVQAFFSKYHSEIGPDEQENALALLEKAVNKQYHGSDPFLMKWIDVVVMADAEELFSEIAAVRSALYEGRYSDLMSEYDRIAESGPKRAGNLKQAICKIIFACCERMDSREDPVPLDIWLLTAGDEISRSFDVFNRISPAILQCNSLEVVRSSRLLQVKLYADAAGIYIQKHGKEAKIVKKWMSDVKQLTKSGGNKRMWSGRKKESQAVCPDTDGSGS